MSVPHILIKIYQVRAERKKLKKKHEHESKLRTHNFD